MKKPEQENSHSGPAPGRTDMRDQVDFASVLDLPERMHHVKHAAEETDFKIHFFTISAFDPSKHTMRIWDWQVESH